MPDSRLQDAVARTDKEVVLYQTPGAPAHLSLRWPIQRRETRYPIITIFDWNRDFRPWAVLGVLLIHAGLAHWLMHFGAGASRIASAQDVDPLVLQIVFLPARGPREHGPSVRTTRTVPAHKPRDAMDNRNAPAFNGKAPAQAAVAADHAGTKPLRLELPESPTVVIGSRAPWSRPTRVEYVPTRFDQRWVAQGDALTQAAWRHKSVAIALSLFGGGGYICTEEDKRKRMRGCSPAIDAGLEGGVPSD
jgi:hypothetical protein